MKRVMCALAVTALLSGCGGYFHVGNLSRPEEAGITRADSSCDDGSNTRSPGNPCYVRPPK